MGKESWGIVGGGIMGITLALNLAKKGHKVTLFESAAELGGLVSPWTLGDIEWDKFYHVILLSDSRTQNLLREAGLENEIRWVETKTGFYVNGKLHSMSDTIDFLKFPPLRLIDKFRLGITIFYASKIKNWKRLEQISVTDWLIRWSGKRTFEKMWLPLLRAKLGESYQKTSAAFIWATIQRLYGARKSGLKKEMFGYVPGGYKRIIEALTRKLVESGVSVKTTYKASEISMSGDGKKSILFANKESHEFDKVVVTLPSGLAADLCSGLTSVEKQKLKDIEYLGVICVAVLLSKSISPYYVTNITDSWVPFTGVIEMSALVDKKNLGGHSLIYLPKYLPSDDPLFSSSDDEIRQYYLTNFRKMYPEIKEDQILFSGVARARHVITVLSKGYSDRLPDVETSIPGLYIINSAHIKDGTLNVNETIKVAESKLDQIVGA